MPPTASAPPAAPLRRAFPARLAALYFLVFGSLGAFLPWFPPLLAERGFTPAMIGLALAVPSLCRAVFPPAWGWLADHLRKPREIVAAGAAIAGLALCAAAFTGAPAVLLALVALYGFLLVPVNPLVESLTFAALGPARSRYGAVRLWGSIGFVVTALGIGLVVRSTGATAGAIAAGLPLVLAGGLALTLRPPERASQAPLARIAPGAGRRFHGLPGRRLALVVAAAALGQGAHGPYYTFFTLDQQARGVAPVAIGGLWSLGVVAEIALMAACAPLLGRIGLAGAIRWSLGLAAARWFLYATGPGPALLAAGQLLHGASFGLLHVASVQWVDEHSPPGRKGLGQSILSAGAYGLGGGAGMYLAGVLRPVAGAGWLYAGSGLACTLGLAVAFLLRDTRDE